jgi:hypothetical protein
MGPPSKFTTPQLLIYFRPRRRLVYFRGRREIADITADRRRRRLASTSRRVAAPPRSRATEPSSRSFAVLVATPRQRPQGDGKAARHIRSGPALAACRPAT